MRSPFLLLAISTTAAAAPALPPLNVHAVPDGCRGVATEPPSARIPGPRYAAYTSAANCMAMAKLRAFHQLSPSKESVQTINDAIRPSVDLLDAVIRTGDPEAALVAEYSKADLYQGASVALLSSVRERDDGAYALTRPWRDQANEGFAEVSRRGAEIANVEARNPVVAYDVQQAARSTTVARR